ncbi:RNA-binding protein MEX3B [Drosophila miranda]|uniref:RNA-binding protein MEX3B n=1 Tax=Drosophila miranda TaxID=7229 RepID=UPI00143F3039|nr:RNA-binding protein MEX3B [Drosophila miranda]XP_033250186.1 RNA-binding protein MEX3B [Drosophila miranda]XP_033250187.1 RNA-binding protein MEX3B [Drosophila miranda]XP_033250189.1 RNA-binding protein MEX3B [Drosophila miranda]
MSETHVRTDLNEFRGVSSGSASISISSSSSSSASASASVSSSSSSSCESGIVLGGNITSYPLSKVRPTDLISFQTKDHSSIRMSAQVASKMLNDSMPDSIHKNNPLHHQMIEQTKVHASSMPLSEDPRTLQLALELSLVGLNDNQNCYGQPALPVAIQNDFEMGSINVVPAVFSKTDNTLPLPTVSGSGLLLPTAAGVGVEDRSKKSQNMTECVPVPSSEHVAEIVGRQGCKIKALRAKTNTYIKTPVRGEEPVFVVTGRKEDVNKAKREILSAADHFSLIRASRKPSIEGHNNGLTGNMNDSGSSGGNAGTVSRMQSGPPCLPGQVTIQVRVPYRVVGLVVGPKGATIKHIQQETQTYIVTPSREKEPIFEVTGLPDNVDTARKQIEAHIALRTGSGPGNGAGGAGTGDGAGLGCESLETQEYGTQPTINSLTQILNDDLNSDILSSIYKSVISPALDYGDNTLKMVGGTVDSLNMNNVKLMPDHHIRNSYQKSELVDIDMPPIVLATASSDNNFSASEAQMLPAKVTNVYRITNKTLSFCPPTSASMNSNSGSNILTRSCSSASSTASTKSTNNSANTPPELLNIWKNISDSIDVDEGIGDSPSIWNLPANTIPTAHCSPTTSISPTDSLLGLGEHSVNRNISRHMKESSCTSQQRAPLVQFQPNSSADKLSIQRECFVCNENEVTTALVPCGHNMFCMDCANQICVSIEAACPICNSIVYHAMRILG